MSNVLLDTSFCVKLLKNGDIHHENAINYYRYFLDKKVEMFLSTIVISEYGVKDDPDNLLSLNTFKIIPFDYQDAKCSGMFLRSILKHKDQYTDKRHVVINDIKLMSQIHQRNIKSFITSDKELYSKYIKILTNTTSFNIDFIDLSIPLNQYLGILF